MGKMNFHWGNSVKKWLWLISLGALPLYAQIQWVNNGKLLASSNASSIHLSAVPDGRGGCFIAYEHNPAGDADIYVNWIDASGNARWGSGVVVASLAGNQRYPTVVPDGSGGVYVAWHDDATTNIHAQRVNASGALQWGTNGIVLCSATGEQTLVKGVSDGAGGAIFVWQDKRNGSTTDLYAQRVNSSGSALWTDNGVPVCTASGNQTFHSAVPDGSGGMLVVWQDARNGLTNYDIFVQRINASGAPQFVSNGMALCTAGNNQISPWITSSGAKWIVAWEDNRGSSSDIYAQAFDGGGSTLWTLNGVPVCTAANAQTSCRIVSDNANGAIVVWADNRTGYDIYGQRLNASGTAQWTTDGIPINTATGYQYAPEIVADGSGSAIVVWNDNRTGSNIELYGQRINASGNLLWDANGLPIVLETGAQQYHVLVSDESGGALAIWQDGRAGKSDIYGQLLNDAIAITQPTGGALWAGTVSQTIQWTNRVSSSRFHHFNIKASVSPGDGFPITVASGISPSTTSQTWTPSSVNSTTVTLKLQAYNDQNVLMDEYLSPTFTIDSNPPNPFDLVSPANGASTELRPTFQWQSTTDNIAGLDHYEVWIDGGLVQTGLSSTQYTLTEAQKLSAGSHTWTIKAVDKLGQVRQANQTWSFTASDDQVPPNPFHLLSPSHMSWTTQTYPLFTWEQATDVGKGIAKYQFYLDDALAQDNIPPSSTSTNGVLLSPGSHTWYVVAVDGANNSTRSVETWTIRMDNVPPQAFDLVQPSHNTWSNDPTPTFSWTASSDGGSGLAEYQIVIDGQVKGDHLSPASTSWTLPESEALSEGSHSWYVVAKDALGNARNSSSTYTLRIDLTPPSAFSLTTPTNASYVTQPSPTFSWQAASDGGSGIGEYRLYIDSILNKQGITSTSTTPASALSEGNHSWYVKAFDVAGNSTTSTAFSFFADFTPPQPFTLIHPASGSTIHTNRPQYKWHSTNDGGSGFQNFELYVDGILKNSFLGRTDTVLTLTESLSKGQHSWEVLAKDKAGNTRSSGIATFTVDINPPVITSPLTAQATEDELFSYTATATDPDGDPLTFSFENYSPWLSPSGNTIRGTPTEGILSGSFKINVTDGIFTVSQVVQITVTPVNDPPQITSPSAVPAIEDVLFTYTATATDPEGDPITFTFSNYPSWLSVSGNTISGIPKEGTPNATFRVTASDGQLSSSILVSVLVQSVNDPPVITSPDSVSATEDIPFSYTATAEDPDGDPLTYTFENYPSWLSVSGNTIQGTPREGTPSTTFKVTVTDGILSVSKTVKLTVIAVNDPPVITSPDSVSATEDIPFSYTANATDPEGSPITFSFQNLPSWLARSGNTLSGTPREGDPSTTFTIIASDGALSTSKTVKLTVIAVNDPPIITSPDSVIAQEDVELIYTATATDPENQPISFGFKNLPYWLTASGATVRGHVPERGKDTTFTVIASDGRLNDTLVVFVHADLINDPPRITSPDTASAVEKTMFSYLATAVDPDGPYLTLRFIEFPSWLTFTGPVLSGTVPENFTQNQFTFKLIASDGLLSDTLRVRVSVTLVNDPPRFEYPFPRPVFESANTLQWELNLDDYVSDPEDPDSTLTWSYQLLDSVRVGITIHPKTHKATFLGFSIDRSFRVLFTVKDPHNASASDTLKVEILKSGVAFHRIAEAPKTFQLFPNYPNPFNPTTTIRYGVPKFAKVCIRIFDIQGRELEVLVNEKHQPGTYEVLWDATGYASGIYFCLFETENIRRVQRMLLLK